MRETPPRGDAHPSRSVHPKKQNGGKEKKKTVLRNIPQVKEGLFTANRNVCLVENGERGTGLATRCSHPGFFIYHPHVCGPCQYVRFGLFYRRRLMASSHIMIMLTFFWPTAQIRHCCLNRNKLRIVTSKMKM